MRGLKDSLPALAILGGVSVIAAATPAWGQCEQGKLLAADADPYDSFGETVAVNGDRIFVGSPLDDDACPLNELCCDSGAAYVYGREGVTWVEKAKLTASDAGRGDHFGGAVALSGNVAVVGAHLDDDACPGDDSFCDSGAAYVYRFDGANWVEEAKLAAADAAPNDYFGASVSLRGDVAVVGAIRDECAPGITACGAVYVFRFDGSTWVEEAKLTASDAELLDFFGATVSVDGNVIVVGTKDDDDACVDDRYCSSGAAYVYRFDGSDWVEEAKLTASDASRYDYFGNSVSISGDVIVVGAFGDDDACPCGGEECCDSGSAYVYRFDGADWVEEAKLTASDAVCEDYFGETVANHGDVLLIGAYGVACADGDRCGGAYVYRFDGADWVEESKLIASDAEENDYYGMAASVHGDAVVIGAYYEDDACADDPFCDSGAAYTYVIGGTDCNENGVPDLCDIADGSSADCHGNGIPDECEIARGNSLDHDGNGMPDECERKNRYLAFAPQTSGSAMAYRVELTDSAYFPDSAGFLGWIGQPGDNGISRVLENPFFSADWPTVVYVADCEIVPATAYLIEATPDGISFFDPLKVSTTAPPTVKMWADVVGYFTGAGWTGPNGEVNLDDIQATVQTFQHLAEAPPLAWVDLDPETPNAIMNFTDIMRVVQGFKGDAYPFSDPAYCP